MKFFKKVRVGFFAVFALVLMFVLGLFGLGGGLDGDSWKTATKIARLLTPDDPADSQKVPTPAGPAALTVTIDGHRYLIEQQEVTVEAILQAASRQTGASPAVVVLRRDSSRASAEARLTESLQKRGISYAVMDEGTAPRPK